MELGEVLFITGDDSGLEYDLDASPPFSAEASAEAAACVKVLISSGLPSVVNMANGSAVEASMTINVPNAQSSKAACGNILPSSSIQGTNITVPVSIQKQSSVGIASEAGETTGDNSQGHRKRRKKVWAEEEDIKLVAAVKQYGEGNWAGMAKEHFKGDRTPGQLYQRWTTMKRKNNSKREEPTRSAHKNMSRQWLLVEPSTWHSRTVASRLPVILIVLSEVLSETEQPRQATLRLSMRQV
ncbi:hypothetical protein Droror1_Dr00011304 [Drosera rotundifolia]